MRFEFSAGGIVYKKEKNKLLILVAQHSQHHGWVFPKGLIEGKKKETKEETALREVKEETGVIGKILKPLTPTTYWYVFSRKAGSSSAGEKEKIRKTVYFFLMEYIAGDIKDHDFEMENVEWLPVDEVEKRLTYKSDKEVWQEAKKLVV